MATVAVVLCAAGVVGAFELHGLPRTLALGLAVLAGLDAGLIVVPMLAVLAGVYLFRGMTAARPSKPQRASWMIMGVVGAVLVGGLVGTDAYAVGIPGLLTGPIVLAAAVIAIQTLRNLSTTARHSVLALSIVGALTALMVGLTIFA